MKSFIDLKQNSNLILEEALKADSNYSFYGLALETAVKLGYTSTILCPILSGSPKEWAHFHSALINEITHFTSLVHTPACLISGGYFDNSADRNLDFAYDTIVDLRNTHPVSLSILDKDGNFSNITNQNFNYSSEENCKNNFAKELEKNTINAQSFRELELRFFLIG